MIKKILNKIGFKKEKKEEETTTTSSKATYHLNKPNVNDNNIYFYYTNHNRLYFKTKQGRRPLKVTAKESVKIVELYKRGSTCEEIYNSIDFYHNIKINTLKHWLIQYDKGLMDIALSWICDNHVDAIDVNKKRLIKKGGY